MVKIKPSSNIDESTLDTGVGFKLFMAIMQKWGVKPAQARILLGDIPRTTYHEWQKQSHPKLSHDTMVRISYIIGIVKGLRIIFGNTERADTWVNKPNKRLNGKTALEFMLHGEILDLDYIRAIIDTARG